MLNCFKSNVLVASIALVVAVVLTGCASRHVALQPTEVSNQSKQFAPPSEGKAGIYVYRDDSFFAAAYFKDTYIDDVCLGETSPGVFFYTEVEGNKTHTVGTESEFSPNEVSVFMKAGKHYFFEQYMRMGVFQAGANIKQVDETTGKLQVQKYVQAYPGICSLDPRSQRNFSPEEVNTTNTKLIQ